MPLDEGERLAQRRRDAEEVDLSFIVIESPIGDPVHGCQNSRFPVALSVSASLRDISSPWMGSRPGEGLDEVAHLAAGDHLGEAFGHGGGGAFAVADVADGDLDAAVLG